ncbi:Pyruvate formate-lyase-activating enzyme [Anoxybacillus sp. BCO1]|nr:Pyruvate formate-lyase-activating enzyme [Anoxybacillus sp. BCO1]
MLVPTVTDDEEDLHRLADFIRTLHNVEKIEVLPYHQLGVYKWKALGLTYPLEGIPTPSEELVEKAKEILGAK